MLDIEYKGLFIDENINMLLEKNDYNTNIILYNKIYDYYKNYKLKEFNHKEIVDLKILITISIKYKNNYQETKELIIKRCNELIQARFHLGLLLLKLLKTKKEREKWLDESIKFYLSTNTDFSLKSLCDFLEDIDEIKLIDKKKYKEIYADTCIKQAENNIGIIANSWLQLALPVYKSLSLKNKYEDALLKYNENMKIVNSEMKKIEISLDDNEIQKEAFKNEKIIRDFFKQNELSIAKKISYLCSTIIFENFGKFNYSYSPFSVTDDSKKGKSLIDFCSVTTFSGNKTVKNHDYNFRYDLIGREISKHMILEPAIDGLLNNNEDKKKIIDEIIKSNLIFEEDKTHIIKALEFFMNNDFNTFIYIIIPNFEKLLRNVLVLNSIPDYTNKDTNPLVQTTLTLTETINKIKDKQLIQPDLICKISQKLNEEDYENYRNILSHRECENIFSKIVAYDLFLLLVQLLYKCNEKELEIFIITKIQQKS